MQVEALMANGLPLTSTFPPCSGPKAKDNSIRWTLVQILVGVFIICLIPYIHIGVVGYLVWPAKPQIDRTSCGCTCFDTVFRGYYESQPGSSYKHWYFNSTFVAYKIWCLMVVGVVTAYECIKFISRCIIQNNIRYSMLILFLLTVYPHYYGWWNYMNYYNEAVYWQWYHQLYFTVSELVSTGLVLHLMRRSTKIQTYHILGVLTVNMSHIIIGGIDQFIENLIYRQGYTAQIFRDLGLVVPDICAVIVILYETRKLATYRKTRVRSLFYKEEIMFCALIATILIFVGKNM